MSDELKTPGDDNAPTVHLPASPTPASPPRAEPRLTRPLPGAKPRTVIGPYRLLQSLGAGGMGEVWEAEQERPVRRRVALKLIKWGMDTREVVARFESERQALALMDHPNIARVLDAGATGEGRPYFVMELVHGVPITQYCDSHRLTTRERLELFAQVCDGVQHAHHKGIIHRDIKPSNILVSVHDDRPLPKIIDFGVAKATAQRLTEQTVYTELGQWLGTPEYMSPEQADMSSLDVDTRTDVYSLGVLLYELLVGTRPLDSGELRRQSYDDLRRRIRETEPRRPSTRVSLLGAAAATYAERRRTRPPELARHLRGDLDWITMKALEKDRTRRYGSAAELAADVRRHLADEPVLAGPPSAAYRLRKLARRHRIGVAVAAASLLVLLLFTAAMAVQAGRIARERDRANREAETSTRIADFLTNLFALSDPSESRGNTVTARELLDRGAESIRWELSAEPLLQARMMETMGQVYQSLGLYRAAEELLNECLALRQRHGTEADVAASLHSLGELHVTTGDYPKAEEELRESLAAFEEHRGKDSLEAAQVRGSLGVLLRGAGRLDEAEAYYLESLAQKRSLLGNDDPETLSALNNLAVLRLSQGDTEAAEGALTEALDGARKVFGDEHPWVVNGLDNLGFLAQQRGELERSVALHREALTLAEKLYGPDHPRVAETLNNLVVALHGLDRLDEAEPLMRRSLAIAERQKGPDHPDLVLVLNNLAALVEARGDLDEAESLYRRSLALARRTLGDHPSTAAALGNLALLLESRDQLDEALETLLEERSMLLRVHGEDHPEVAVVLLNLGYVQRRRGHLDESEELYRRALAILRPRSDVDPIQLAAAASGLAQVFLDRHAPTSALPLVRETERLYAEALPQGHWRHHAARSLYGAYLAASGSFDEAETVLCESLVALEKRPAVQLSAAREARLRLVRLYEAWGRSAEAQRIRSGGALCTTAAPP